MKQPTGTSLHRIVIVGGGAGGLELAVRLGKTRGKAEVVLVDAAPTHVWKSLLHQVAVDGFPRAWLGAWVEMLDAARHPGTRLH